MGNRLTSQRKFRTPPRVFLSLINENFFQYHLKSRLTPQEILQKSFPNEHPPLFYLGPPSPREYLFRVFYFFVRLCRSRHNLSCRSPLLLLRLPYDPLVYLGTQNEHYFNPDNNLID